MMLINLILCSYFIATRSYYIQRMTTRISIILIICFCISSQFTFAQYDKRNASAHAFDGEINLDGRLDEAAWSAASVATGFTEFEPTPNEPADQKSEIRVIYNDDGLYVGAELFDDNPDAILRELSLRDNKNNADWFGVILDTYRDGLNGFSFAVTAAGVQLDVKYAGGEEDSNWDAVWQSEVVIHDKGWTAEMFIPYSAIRFPQEEIQQWNIQFVREVRRNRATNYWNPVDPNFEGLVNQCGHLDGIKNIESPVRLSVTPYVTGYVNNVRDAKGNTETGTSYNAGMDLKYGINDAFTLDMTLVPDFGQVQSDNQVLNLGPFEVFFEENRQFFTEGLELFDRGRLFYTRRVGGRPIAYGSAYSELQAGESVIENPNRVQLYNATKVSGRTASGTGIGFFNAVTRKTEATIANALGETRTVTTNPVTNYNVMVVDQNLPNNSRVSLINTNVMRNGSYYDANTTGAFFNLNNKSQAYALNGKYVRSNQFFTEGNNAGYSYNVETRKNSGKIRGYLGTVVESDTYNPNDLGFLFSPNERSFYAGVSYNEPKVEGIVQKYEYALSTKYGRLFKPNVYTDFDLSLRTFYLYKSRNAFGGTISVRPVKTHDYFEPRDGFNRYLAVPASWSINPFFSSDYRKAIAGNIRFDYEKFDEEGRNSLEIEVEPRIRINNNLSFFGTLNYQRINNNVGYANASRSNEAIPGLGTDDILMGRRDIDIISNSIRGQYIFNNKHSISLRVRHYHSRVRYNQFARLVDEGALSALDYTGVSDDGEYLFDRNYNVFNIDMNYTWRFAPGSDIILNFKNQIEGEDSDYDADYWANLSGLGDKRQDNSLSLRVIYFLDYLYLK